MALNKVFAVLVFCIAVCRLAPDARAQSFSIEDIAEFQTDFKGGANFVNLLHLSTSMPVTKWMSVHASTISIVKSRNEPLVSDLQGYSNIEEENTILAPSVLGAEFKSRSSTFFLGVRNVNEDYFTSSVTSLFTNSSCGIFPTLSANYNIANYPFAGFCIHYSVEFDRLELQTSIYNGLGYKRLFGKWNVFRVIPAQDGVFSIASITYMPDDRDDKQYGNYNFGVAAFWGMRNIDEAGSGSVATKSVQKAKTTSFAPWLSVEQALSDRFCLLLQGSVSTVRTGCNYYVGAGARLAIKRTFLGLFADYAKFSSEKEIATEATCQIQIADNLFLQPVLHLIYTSHRMAPVGLVRFTWSM